MMQRIRHIAFGGSARELSGLAKLAAWASRGLSFVVMLVFLLDAINADVLYAAVKGQIRFQDNPLIIDSQFDTTSVIPDCSAPTDYFQLVKYASGPTSVGRHFVPHFLGTTIVEDVDSPTVLDGATTATLSYSIQPYPSFLPVVPSSAPPTVDRTITFSCLLI